MGIPAIVLIIVVAGLRLAIACRRLDAELADTVKLVIAVAILLAVALASIAFVFFPNTDFAQVIGQIMAGIMLLAGSFVGGMFLGRR